MLNYVYSYTGQLLMEDRITESTWNNYIYFNGQMVAIHQQDDHFRLLFKDHLGNTRSVLKVHLPESNWQYNWTLVETADFLPYGMQYRGYTFDTPPTGYMYEGKSRDGGLDYFGARYYDGSSLDTSSTRWISPDQLTARIYDPPSLNKYTYVTNDPVNMVDPDGRSWLSAIVSFLGKIVDAIVSAVDFYIDSWRELATAPPLMGGDIWDRGRGGPSDEDYGHGGANQGFVAIFELPAENIKYMDDIDASCGPVLTAGGCERVDYRPDFVCVQNSASMWTANYTISLTGNIYVAKGPFPYKGRDPQDHSITDTASALRHEQRHVDDLVNALRNLFQGFAKFVSGSEEDCKETAGEAEKRAITVADQARRDSAQRRG
ncbi:MAG: hypothetical protein LAP85_26595 [Acidobacteriia bacterium]|nr:hypothetical protein [Terriglobia bacterium]